MPLKKERAFLPFNFFTLQPRQQASAIDDAVSRQLGAAGFDKCGSHINVRGRDIELARLEMPRPADEERHSQAALIHGSLAAAQAAVEACLGRAVVAEENHN